MAANRPRKGHPQCRYAHGTHTAYTACNVPPRRYLARAARALGTALCTWATAHQA